MVNYQSSAALFVSLGALSLPSVEAQNALLTTYADIERSLSPEVQRVLSLYDDFLAIYADQGVFEREVYKRAKGVAKHLADKSFVTLPPEDRDVVLRCMRAWTEAQRDEEGQLPGTSLAAVRIAVSHMAFSLRYRAEQILPQEAQGQLLLEGLVKTLYAEDDPGVPIGLSDTALALGECVAMGLEGDVREVEGLLLRRLSMALDEVHIRRQELVDDRDGKAYYADVFSSHYAAFREMVSPDSDFFARCLKLIDHDCFERQKGHDGIVLWFSNARAIPDLQLWIERLAKQSPEKRGGFFEVLRGYYLNGDLNSAATLVAYRGMTLLADGPVYEAEAPMLGQRALDVMKQAQGTIGQLHRSGERHWRLKSEHGRAIQEEAFRVLRRLDIDRRMEFEGALILLERSAVVSVDRQLQDDCLQALQDALEAKIELSEGLLVRGQELFELAQLRSTERHARLERVSNECRDRRRAGDWGVPREPRK